MPWRGSLILVAVALGWAWGFAPAARAEEKDAHASKDGKLEFNIFPIAGGDSDVGSEADS